MYVPTIIKATSIYYQPVSVLSTYASEFHREKIIIANNYTDK